MSSSAPLPPFYRVAAKALVFDDQKRLLMVQNEDGYWDYPGGGWESGESFAECLQREFGEELGIPVQQVGDPVLVFRGTNKRGHTQLRICAVCTIPTHSFTPGDDIVGAAFVTKHDMLTLEHPSDNMPIGESLEALIKRIWAHS